MQASLKGNRVSEVRLLNVRIPNHEFERLQSRYL